MRREFEMSEDDLRALLDAGKPVPAMYLTGGQPMFGASQENANLAWQRLGEKLGFQHMTVQPIAGKDHRFFSAEENPGDAAPHQEGG